MISFDEFKKMEIKTGKIKEVANHPKADRLYVVKIDLGSEERTAVAGIKQYYEPQQLIGKDVIVVTNLEPALIRGIESKAMLLAAQDEAGIAILTTHRPVAAGSPVK